MKSLPLRTLSMAGLYPRRQRSVNSAQSMVSPLGDRSQVI